MKRIIFSGLIGVVALLALLALRVDAKEKNTDANQKSRTKWEYATLECPSQKELAKMGDEGWEMVAVVTTINKWEFGFSTPEDYGRGKIKLSDSAGANGVMKGSGNCSMYFKRQK